MNGDDLKIYSDHALRGGATSVKQIHPIQCGDSSMGEVKMSIRLWWLQLRLLLSTSHTDRTRNKTDP